MNIPQHSFPQDDVIYISPTWQNMAKLTEKISEAILADNQKIDRLVTLAKGGWTMARTLVDWLNVSEVASIGVKFYKDIGERYAQPQIYQDLPVAVHGENILLFDDVADSGESLKFAVRYLSERGVTAIKTATLFYKPKSVIVPDYYGYKTSAWIIFPHEIRESRQSLTERWESKGIKPGEIRTRLKKLNLL